MADDYGGLLGAFPYAFRASGSTLFRVYVAVGGLLALVLSVAFGISFLTSIAGSVGLAAGGTSSFVRSFVVLAGFLVVLPLLAPVIFAARDRRRTGGSDRHDAAVGLAGFGYALSLYLGLVASMPPSFVLDGERVTRPAPSGLVAPVVDLLYALPPLAAPLIPLAAAVMVYLVHRRFR